MKKIIILLSITILAFCGGSNKSEAPDAPPNEHAEEPAVSNPDHKDAVQGHVHEELHISSEKQKEWGIKVYAVEKQKITPWTTLPGILTLNLNKTAHISSFVHGKVVSFSSDLGMKVRTGQEVVTINSPEFAQAQADFLRARSEWKLTRKEVERATMLLKEKAIEEKEYLRRAAEYERISMEYGALGSALHSYGITHEQIDELVKKCDSLEEKEYKCEIANPNLPIMSPLSGTIIFRDVILGENVEPNKILFTVSDLSTLWAQLDAYEKDLPFISQESKVTIISPLYPNKGFEGNISTISDLIDEKLRTVKVRAEVKNEGRLLKPNMYIQAKIEKRALKKDSLAVPEEAIQNLNGEKIIFVWEEEENIFAVRHVELGQKVGEMRIITKGLEEGEKIAVTGAFRLKSELSRETFGHAHVH